MFFHTAPHHRVLKVVEPQAGVHVAVHAHAVHAVPHVHLAHFRHVIPHALVRMYGKHAVEQHLHKRQQNRDTVDHAQDAPARAQAGLDLAVVAGRRVDDQLLLPPPQCAQRQPGNAMNSDRPRLRLVRAGGGKVLLDRISSPQTISDPGMS